MPVAEGAGGEAEVEVARQGREEEEERNRGQAAAAVEALARNRRFLDRNRNQPIGRNPRAAIAAAAADARRSPGPVEEIARYPRKGRVAEAATGHHARLEAVAALDCPASAAAEAAGEIVLRSVPTIGRADPEETTGPVEIIVPAQVIAPAETIGQIAPAAETMISLVSPAVVAVARRGREVVVPVETIVLVKVAVFAPVAIIVRVPAQASCQIVLEVAVAAIVSRIGPEGAATATAGPISARATVRSVRHVPPVLRNGRTFRTRATISGTSGSRTTR